MVQSRLDAFKRQRKNDGDSVDSQRAYVYGGVHLPISKIGRVALLKMQEMLSVVPRATYDRATIPDAVQCFRLSQEHIVVPRAFGFDYVDGNALDDRRRDGVDLREVTFHGSLKPGVQEDAYLRSLVELDRPPHCCVLTLPCGYGKTVVALKIAHAVNKRTLVVLHKEFLLSQWRERISQFLPEATVGIIQGSRVVGPNSDIMLGMLQTLCSRLSDHSTTAFEAAAACGLVVIDEAHHMGARWFSEVFFHLPSKRILGLTATPVRKDGCIRILHMFMGKHSFSLEDRNDDRDAPILRNIVFASTSRLARDISAGETQRLKTTLTKDPRRNKIILDTCLELVGAGRNVLCLSDRVAHLKYLLAGFLERCAPTASASLYVGGQKQEERSRAEKECQMLFGTFAMAQEGLDVARLDTLVLASPASDVTQAVGRILRPCAEKQEPLIVDMQDDLCLQFLRQNEHRRRFYSRSGISLEGGAAGTMSGAARYESV